MLKPVSKLKFLCVAFAGLLFLLIFQGVVEAAPLDILTPAANDKVRADTFFDITWDTNNTIERIDLYYHNGSYFEKVDTDLANTGSYSWFVPDYSHSSARIMLKVTETDSSVTDIVSDTFVVDNDFPAVNWIKPEAGEYLISSVKLEVDAADIYSGINEVRFLLECDTELATLNFWPYEYTWNTAGLPEDTYTICAVAEDNAHVPHRTVSEIEVVRKLPAVNIIYPDSSAVLAGGDTEVVTKIEWNADTPGLDDFDRTRVSYSVNGGDTYEIIDVIDPPTQTFYEWEVPEHDTDLAKIKLTFFESDGGDSETFFEVESDTFIIDSTAPQLDLVTPDTQSYWLGGDTETISWQAPDGGISGYDSFILRYQTQPGQSWQQIDSVVPSDVCSGDSCEYDWLVAENIISDQVRMQIRAYDKAGNRTIKIGDYFSVGEKPAINLSNLEDGDTIGYSEYQELLVTGTITGDSGYVSALKINAGAETEEINIEPDNKFYHLVSYDTQAEEDTVTRVSLDIWTEDITGDIYEQKELTLWVDLINPNLILDELEAVTLDPRPEQERKVVAIDTDSYRASDTAIYLHGSVDKPYYHEFNYLRVFVNEAAPVNLELFEDGDRFVFDDRSGTVSLDTGLNEAEVVYVDSSGNDTRITFDIQVDLTPPPVTVIDPDSPYTADTEIDIKIGSNKYAAEARIGSESSWRAFVNSGEDEYDSEVRNSVEIDTSKYRNEIEITIKNDVGLVSDTVYTVYYHPEQVFFEDVKPDALIRGESEFVFSFLITNHSDTDYILSEENIGFGFFDYTGSGAYDTQLIVDPAPLEPGDSHVVKIEVSDFSDTSDSVGLLLEFPGDIYDTHERRIIEYEDIKVKIELLETPEEVRLGEEIDLKTKVENDSAGISLSLEPEMIGEVIRRDSVLGNDTDIGEYFDLIVEDISDWQTAGDSNFLYIEHTLRPAANAPLGAAVIELNPFFTLAGMNSWGQTLDYDSVTINIISDPENPVLGKVFHYYSKAAGSPGPADPDSEHPVYFCFELDQSEAVEFKLYTLTGELVWKTKKDATAGKNVIEWPGINKTGASVASGGYIYRINLASDNSKDYLGKIAIHRR